MKQPIAWVVAALAAASSGPLAQAAPAGGPELATMDRSVDPCADFYRYACGGWMASHPVPPDESRWGRFSELAESNRTLLREILEKAASGSSQDPIDRKIGDYYASCMDEAGIEKRGLEPLRAEMERIAALKDVAGLAGEVAHLHQMGVRTLFEFNSQQDFKDATTMIAGVDQGGLGLPDRDDYLREDPKSAQVRQQYVAHVERMLSLAGEPAEAAAAHARSVMQIETALARVSLERVKRRDPANRYHKLKRQDLVAVAPHFPWDTYLTSVEAPAFGELNVSVPDFFKGLDGLVAATDIESWKAYLRWHLLTSSASMLPERFVDEDFAFNNKVLRGAKELRPRWKRCVQATDMALPDALGQRYVARAFSPESKRRTEQMVAAIFKAMERDLHDLTWMTPATKTQALEKLRAIAHKIGYPEKWRDYSALEIVRGDALGNERRADAFEVRYRLGKIGHPVDRLEFRMSPPTVNAYYSSAMNDINFPAGILQPPFYAAERDEAVNFGGVGVVIGHELTHGFDDQGRKFDAVGNWRDWWSEADGKEFERRASCLADEYSSFTAVDDVKLDGRLTLGENTADNGGVRLALMALQDSTRGGAGASLDGFTAPQRLFLGFAQVWCSSETPEVARLLARTDPHSPGRYRVNGVLSNMPEFRAAFGCPATSPMVRESSCRVW
jgi:endothelin-converting enzyme/putative endopeptidase